MGVLSEKRADRITASAVGAILGVNPYQSADDQMRVLVRQYHKAEREFKGNEATEHGQKYEPVAIAEYKKTYGCEVEEDPDFVIHREHDWIGCTPDGLIGKDGMIEVKCPYYTKKPYTLDEKPMYLYQVYLQLVCTGRIWCDFYVWTDDKISCERVYFINAKKWFDDNLEKLRGFYDHYLEIVEDEKLSAPYLEDKEIDLTKDMSWFVATEKYKRAKLEVELATELMNEHKKELLELAKKHDKKCSGNGVMAFKSVRKGAIDYKKVPGVSDVNLDDYRKKDSVIWSVR